MKVHVRKWSIHYREWTRPWKYSVNLSIKHAITHLQCFVLHFLWSQGTNAVTQINYCYSVWNRLKQFLSFEKHRLMLHFSQETRDCPLQPGRRQRSLSTVQVGQWLVSSVRTSAIGIGCLCLAFFVTDWSWPSMLGRPALFLFVPLLDLHKPTAKPEIETHYYACKI